MSLQCQYLIGPHCDENPKKKNYLATISRAHWVSELEKHVAKIFK